MRLFLTFLLIFLWGCEPRSNYQIKANVTELLSEKNDTTGFKKADRVIPFQFPQDHGPHPEFKTEWWYYTGNLQSEDGSAEFGFQLTFFRNALRPVKTKRNSQWATNQTYLAHFTLSDLTGQKFYFAERNGREGLGLAGAEATPFKVWLEDWQAKEENDKVHLSAENDQVKIDLFLQPEKPIILNGNQGLSQKTPKKGNASYYYSQTRLKTTGTVLLNGKTIKVKGLSWFDREWSTSVLGKEQTGWDWFSLQLDDQRELMLFQLRQANGQADQNSAGTFIDRQGKYRPLKKADFSLTVLENWSSPITGINYPSGWRVRIPSENLDLEVYPLLKDQELRLFFTYWEGAVKVSGSGTNGRGYVELTGYQQSGK